MMRGGAVANSYYAVLRTACPGSNPFLAFPSRFALFSLSFLHSLSNFLPRRLTLAGELRCVLGKTLYCHSISLHPGV